MILKKNKEKNPKVNKKKLDKRNYFFFALFGVVLIAILMILQTRFKESLRLNNDGYAVISNTVTEYLSINPAEEDVEDLVKMQSFDAMDYIYTQGGKYYLGDKKKVEIDTSYPLYVNQGAILQLLDDAGVLYDGDYEKEVTYEGLYIQGGYAYNKGGEKADHCKYTFLGMKNGNFINFDTISYRLKNEELDINENSLVHFDSEYFAYFEYEEGELLYKYCVSVNDTFKLKVGDKEYTYDELLKLLGLRTEHKGFEGIDKEEPPQEETDIADDVETDLEVDKDVDNKKPQKQEVDPPSAPSAGGGHSNTNSSPGVRPDNVTRPGSSGNTSDAPEPDESYVQPVVTINSVTANVYRILVEATIYDPAGRIDKNKNIRFEVYEIDSKGNEQLCMRSYRRGDGKNTTVLGSGVIKPETKYRVTSYYTYMDAYDEEQYVDLGSWNVETGKFEDLTDITLIHQQGSSYNNFIEVVNLSYDNTLSDDELVYGINTYGGMNFIVKEKSTQKVVTTRKLTSAEIGNFKNRKALILNSLRTLKPKTEYQYEFEAEDYFGNTITLKNNIGYAMTSNSAPVATVVEKTNEIGNIVLGLSIEDVDVAAVPSASTTDAEDACDVYFIISKEDLTRYSSRYTTLEELEAAGLVVYCKKLVADGNTNEYTYDETNGLNVSDLDIQLTNLRLGEKFYATVFADYNLNNQRGPQYFQNIGQMSFKTTDLNSLGKIYVTSDLDLKNLTYKSLPMSFHLNKKSTDVQLANLITGMKIDIVRGDGKGDDAIVDATFSFDENTLAADDSRVLDQFKDKAVAYLADNLQSMTEYRINATIYAKYQDEVYEIIPQLTNYTFKTLRRPAEVEVKDMLFAAGTLIFDVKVDDPDGTIIGVSGDKVLVQLYTQSGEFIKTTRITKNLEDWLTVQFDNLDPQEKYELRFLASEYNEGYTNASYLSNKIIKVVKVDKSMSLTGTIKLQAINSLPNVKDKYQAVVKATLNDKDHYLSGNDAIPYYIKVERGIGDEKVVVEDTAYDLSGEPVATLYEKMHRYEVLKGEYTYTLTMYIIVSGRYVELDTITFTTETTVKGFGTAYEMIQLLKNDSDGKFVATNSFVLNSNAWNYQNVVDPGDVGSMSQSDVNALGKGVSGANIVNIFDGNIDFQGFTLSHNIYADNQRMFTNIGSKGIFQNVVYSVKNLNETRIYDDAALCFRNFGVIRDIYVKYRGGYVLNNEYYGILTRVNSATGIIENFVVENVPDEGFAGFSAYRYAGLLTYDNYGIIRYGYVYGDNIITTTVDQSLTREMGGIVGANRTLGNIYSVYSLLNVDDTKRRPDPNSEYTFSSCYGAVCGQSWGKMSNMYSTKDSAIVESKHSDTFGKQHSPIIGIRNNATNSNVYYYSDSNYSEAATRAKAVKMELKQLYDVSWQRTLLTDNFDVSLVEVGYYPHVILSEDLPEQEYIPLPERVMIQPVEVSRATVLKYGTTDEGVDYAEVQFVFTNRDGLDIIGVGIKDNTIDVELDLQSARYADGYTTIEGIISNPKTFYSEYIIESVSYYKNGKITTNAVDYTLKADFFRKVYTVDDWYNYMVNRKKVEEFENVKLEADLDFSNVDPSRIMVKLGFNRILDGNGHKIEHINLQKGFNVSNNTTIRRLFIGDLAYSGIVRNLFINDYKAGGSFYNSTKGKTYVARSASVLGTVYGKVENVHVKDVMLTTYEYAAGLVCYLAASGEVQDSSVTNLILNYNDPDDVNAESFIGGLVGRMNESRLTHCFTRNIDIKVDETKATYGIGGVVGYAVNSVIDTAYSEGEIVSRAQKVGGIVGHYYCTNASVACMKNMWAKVNIVCYTDIAGALVGQTNLTQDRISPTNNFTGIGFGNIYLSNLDSVNCSQTIGVNLGKNVTFYGTHQQLINGISGVGYAGKEDSVRGLLKYEDLVGENAYNSYFNTVGFENVYKVTSDGKLPKMYYTGRNATDADLLPNQTEITLDELVDKGIDIRVIDVIHNPSDRLVTVELENENNYKITSIGIDKLKYHFVNMALGPAGYSTPVSLDEATDYYQGITRIYLQYDIEQQQDYFLDSYVMDEITFYPVEESASDRSLVAANLYSAGKCEELPISSRINVMLCKDIPNYNAWNEIPGRGKEHDYENYRITGEIDFSTAQTATNLKIGRLISDNGNRTIKNIKLNGPDIHLISRLNSGIQGLEFDNIYISSSGVGCIGIVGVSNGTVINCDFSNILILPQSGNTDEIGIVGHSNSGIFKNIHLENIKITANKSSLDYVGGLAGKVQDGSSFENISGKNIDIMATGSYVGGVLGGTEICTVNNVKLADVLVDGRSSYTGGFGGYIGYNSNSRGNGLNDIELVGTPTYDSDGRVIDSTTKIKGNNYTGGVAGATYLYVGESYVPSQSEPNLNVNGIVVTGLNRIGGAFGWSYSRMYHLTVQNAKVETRKELMNKTTAYSYAGGVIGETAYSTSRAVYADNVVVDTLNTNYIGGLGGMIRYTSVQFSYTKDCIIKGSTTAEFTGTVSNVGGITGLYENTMLNCGVMNTVIDTPKHHNVGGVVGRLSQSIANNHNIGNCYYLANYDVEAEDEFNHGSGTRYTAAATEDYYIKGYTNVGGIVGMQNSGYVYQSYSNGNVIANNGEIAGGISGMYCNEFTTSVSNGKTYYTYAVTGMYRNYFAGSVIAYNGYAGGAIGRTGMLYRGRGLDENNQISLSGKNGNRVKDINANANEENKTYGNIVIADKIIGGAGTSGAFAADDTTLVFNGINNRIWDHTILNGDFVAAVRNNSGKHAYRYWNESDKVITAYPLWGERQIQLFQSTDVDGSKIIDAKHNRASVFYRSIGWSLSFLDKAAQDYVSRDSAWRVSVGDVDSAAGKRGLYNKYETLAKDTGTYLPQPRQATNVMYAKDVLIKEQESVCRLPLPRDTELARPMGNDYATFGMRSVDNTYGMVYASDVDKLNLEFSKDLVDNGYFVLKSGDTVIAKEVITQRAYTVSYPYNVSLTFEYGFLTDNTLDETEILYPANYEEMESVVLSENDLRTDIMVYHNDYYYISENGLVSTAGTWAGEFVHVMNGKVLDTTGNIWNVETRKKVGVVSPIELLSEVSPLWNFKYGVIDIDTYAKYSSIESEYNTIERNSQLFVVNDELYTVDGSLETRKTDILLYKLNGEMYQTVLGNDGMMVDMMQDDWNIPEEVENQAIVRMSNTLNASVPYVLVEYNNGGIIGYNYATGEILFDNSIETKVSLWDYAVSFFADDEESQYANISKTYSANAQLSDQIRSSKDLDKIVDNSSDDLIKDNGSGENTSSAAGIKDKADSSNTQAGDGVQGSSDAINGQGKDEEEGVDDGKEGTFVSTEETEPEKATQSENTTDSEESASDELNETSTDDEQSKEDKDSEDKEDNLTETETSKESDSTEKEQTQSSETEKTDETDETVSDDADNADNTENTDNSKNQMVTDDQKDEVGAGEFMTVYNNETGVYEIVSVAEYLTEDAYISENHRLGVKDLSQHVSSGYAVSTIDESQERGIFIYIIPIFIIFAIAGGIFIYVKRNERKTQ